MTIKRLQRIAAIVAEHDERLGTWFADALEQFNQGEDIGHALELTATALRARRDAALRAAADLIDIDSQHGKAERVRLWCAWCKANRKRGPIHHWCKLEAHDDPNANQVERLVTAALDTGLAVPTSTKQIERILAVGHDEASMSKPVIVEASLEKGRPRWATYDPANESEVLRYGN